MATLKLKYVETFKDRYGKRRHYFRKGKGERFALQGEPGSDAFNKSYAIAFGKAEAPSYSQDRTFNALARAYYQSVKFLKIKESSKRIVRVYVDGFLKDHGHRLVSQMTMQHVDMIVAAKAATPGAANSLLKYLRVMMKLAVRLEWITRDPTTLAEKFKLGSHHTWTEKEIAQYEKRWPLGSVERVAFDLHLYTGQRLGDVNAMKPSDIDGLFIHVAQEKVDAERKDEKLVIPMHSNLVRSLNVWARVGKTIITKQDGGSYKTRSYGAMLALAIEAAGLPSECVPHGLRKAAARRLAEAGCSASQIAAITGHASIAEVERYVRAANQGLLAGQAIESLGSFKKA